MSTVTILSTASGIELEVLLGEGEVELSNGESNWEVIDRPNDLGVVEFTGATPYTMKVPLMFDGFSSNEDVSQDVKTLLSLVRSVEGPRAGEPDSFKILGPVPFSGETTWVASTYTWGPSLKEDNILYRQEIELEVVEYVRPDLTTFRRFTPPKPQRPKRYRVKKGDTLFSIAIKFYHNRSKWKLIAKRNKIRDPRKLKVGQVLKLP